MASAHFRAGVVAVVRHPDMQRFLVLERADMPGSWQFPQGGIHAGEAPYEAAWRELGEETGLTPEHVVARAEFPDWIAYEWPVEVQRTSAGQHHRIGQVQRWFLFDAHHAEIEPVPDGTEFIAWQWANVDWILSQLVDWRRSAYEQVLGSLS
jgi:putative (di)nucleoside polyphosphate hydrolase